MFNDLTNSNNQNPKPVDDIFAETDKAVETKKQGAYNVDPEIEAKPAGILSDPVSEEASSKGKIIKIALLALLVILLLALIYLAYDKFFAKKAVIAPVSQQPITNEQNNDNEQIPLTPVTETETSTPLTETASTTSETIPTSTPVSVILDSDSDGLMDEEERALGTDLNLLDTDSDGLSDYEEIRTYSINPLMMDSDNDELSDYHEIKIYKTDPNKVDTDGDTYSDGGEVNSGYNPLGAGKLSE